MKQSPQNRWPKASLTTNGQLRSGSAVCARSTIAKARAYKSIVRRFYDWDCRCSAIVPAILLRTGFCRIVLFFARRNLTCGGWQNVDRQYVVLLFLNGGKWKCNCRLWWRLGVINVGAEHYSHKFGAQKWPTRWFYPSVLTEIEKTFLNSLRLILYHYFEYALPALGLPVRFRFFFYTSTWLLQKLLIVMSKYTEPLRFNHRDQFI